MLRPLKKTVLGCKVLVAVISIALPVQARPSCATPINLVIAGQPGKPLSRALLRGCPELKSVKGISELPSTAVVISDAKTGELLWSAGNYNGATLPLSRMLYRVSAGIAVVDLNLDGFGDQIIFVDTGGQVWRLFGITVTVGKVRGSTFNPWGGEYGRRDGNP